MGCDPNTRVGSGPNRSAPLLFNAVGRGHDKIVKILLDAGADPNMEFNGVSSVLLAIARSSPEMVSRLIQRNGLVTQPPTADVSCRILTFNAFFSPMSVCLFFVHILSPSLAVHTLNCSACRAR